MTKRKKGIIATFTIAGFILACYLLMLDNNYNYVVCSCAAHYNTELWARVIGYFLLVVSTFLFLASVWRIKKLSRLWAIPALIVFGIAYYGNGYKFYYLACMSYIEKITFFNHYTTLGEFAAPLNIDSLQTGKYDGKLLGYSVSENELTLYKINEKPLKVKTSFLFWKIRPTIFVNTLSTALHSYRNLEFEKNNNGYERIGGKDMPLEVFMREIFYEKELEFAGNMAKLKNKQIINAQDGTTRFRFEIE